jgi:hypothetical protein
VLVIYLFTERKVAPKLHACASQHHGSQARTEEEEEEEVAQQKGQAM